MNNKLFWPTFLCFCLFSTFSCQRPFLSDDDVSSKANWEKVGFTAERPIRGIHATPFEWQIITENEFVRFDGENELQEIRPLSTNSGVLGSPALSDNTFVRLTTNDDAKQELEFHLARNPSEIHKLLVDSLAGPTDDFVEVEFQARQVGVFSDDGTIFLLPVKVLPGRHYVLLMFQVLHNVPHTSFTSVEVIKRINLVELSTDLPRLNALRFVNGNFYVTSQEGTWRITPSGNVEQLFTQWMIDVFPFQGDIYITGLNSFDLHQSTDNGINWERLNQNSELKFVTNANEILFTQAASGLVYQTVDDDLLKAQNIVFPNDYSPQDVVYFGNIFFAGKHYFALDRAIYLTETIVVE
ncbi:MAG: hypothetical protein AAFZ15_10240 [Bacteroidota bacterium]